MRRTSSFLVFNFLAGNSTIGITTRTVSAFETVFLNIRLQSTNIMSKTAKNKMQYSTQSSSSLLTIPSWFNAKRMRTLREVPPSDEDEDKKCIVYWMQRDMRVDDNWALCYAQYLSKG